MPTLFKTLTALGISVLSLSVLAIPAKAVLIYDDTIDGDLSNNRLAPTVLSTLSNGINTLRYAITNPDPLTPNRSNRDLEFFTLTIPTGFQLSQLIITEYIPEIIGGVIATDQISFIAVQRGTQLTQPSQPSEPNGMSVITDARQLLGYTLIGSQVVASFYPAGLVNAPFTDILPQIGAIARPNQPNGTPSPIPNQGLGFLPPLPAGDYVFWSQQTSLGTATIQLDFVVSSVPEPTSTTALFALGGLAIVIRCQRRRREK